MITTPLVVYVSAKSSTVAAFERPYRPDRMNPKAKQRNRQTILDNVLIELILLMAYYIFYNKKKVDTVQSKKDVFKTITGKSIGTNKHTKEQDSRK